MRKHHLCSFLKETIEHLRQPGRVPKRVGVAKAELIYYSIYFTCVFGGKKYKNKGTGQRMQGRAISIASSIDSPTTSYPIFDLCIYTVQVAKYHSNVM